MNLRLTRRRFLQATGALFGSSLVGSSLVADAPPLIAVDLTKQYGNWVSFSDVDFNLVEFSHSYGFQKMVTILAEEARQLIPRGTKIDFIIQLPYAGSFDPLGQRGEMGWKYPTSKQKQPKGIKRFTYTL